ncbi:hypothetical protein B484DRAFT_405462, partial [Ochromonadaceae sp. CCMP2298]
MSLPVAPEETEVVNLEADALKEQGNVHYRAAEYSLALSYFNRAVELDCCAKYLVNRSLCHAALLDWGGSFKDAQEAAALSPKNTKAHFRMVKACLALARYKQARLALLNGLRLCGESKDLLQLEEEIYALTQIALRPKSTDFEIVGELGEGNFS